LRRHHDPVNPDVHRHAGDDRSVAPTRLRRGLRGIAISVLRLAVLCYVLLAAFLFLFQDHLIFFPRPLADAARTAIAERVPRAEELRVTAPDDVELHGWLRHPDGPPASGPAPLVLYFGGNAEEVSWLANVMGQYPPWAFALFNYRGFGLSGGAPGEEALYADALALYDRLTARGDVDGSRVVAFGRSLGSAVAVHLAAERDVAGVILVTPLDSVTSVAEGVYPFMPVRLMLRHPFDAISRAPEIEAPALFLAAGRDRVIPVPHAERLREAWGGPTRWVLIEGESHDSIASADAYWSEIGAFLERRAAGEEAAGGAAEYRPGRDSTAIGGLSPLLP